MELLNSLQDYLDYRVRTEACLAAASLSPTKNPCLDRLQLDMGFDMDFDFHVRQQIHTLKVGIHSGFGSTLPTIFPQLPLPGPAMVRSDLKTVKVWWPW
jgi:hypothetical protein